MGAVNGAAALAVAEILDVLNTPLPERGALARRLRPAVVTAIVTVLATRGRRRKRWIVPKPSRN